MAGALYIFFDQHGIVTKAVFGFAFAGGQRGVEIGCLLHHTHAFTATASAGLDEHRVADSLGFTLQQIRVLVHAVVTGYQRYPCLLHQLFRSRLEPHGANGQRRRPDEHQTRICAGLGKSIVFAQKTIPGVNRLRTGRHSSIQNVLPLQVAVFGGVAAHVNGFITSRDMFRIGVHVRIDRHRLDGHPPGGGRNTAGDLTPVCNKDFFEHGLFQCEGERPSPPSQPRMRRKSDFKTLNR